MKAITITGFGGIEVLSLSELEKPAFNADQVLIKSKGISINPIDIKTRKGKGIAESIKNELPAIIGWDVSGVVEEVGADVKEFKKGDQVFGMLAFPMVGKTYAEYVAANASQITFKPAATNHEEAAAACLAAITALQALSLHAKIKSGDRVLIHAGSGGVGHYAIQMAKHLGAYVITTSSEKNKDFVLSIGADEHIDYENQRFEDSAKNLDYVLDTIGGDYIDRSLTVIKKGGTIISIPSGLNDHVEEHAAAVGVTGKKMKVVPGSFYMGQINQLLTMGIIRTHLDKVFPFENMAEAHQLVESGRTVGKVSLKFEN